MSKMRWVTRQVLAVVGSGLIFDLCTPEIAPSARAESLNLKPGAWESTGTVVTSGTKIPPAASAHFTPEQRAKMEAALKARDGKPMTTTDTFCLTKEDIAHDHIIKSGEDEDRDGKANCVVKVHSKSSSKLVADRICSGPLPVTGHFSIEAKTPESFVLTIDSEISGGGKTHSESKGRWLGASCEGIED